MSRTHLHKRCTKNRAVIEARPGRDSVPPRDAAKGYSNRMGRMPLHGRCDGFRRGSGSAAPHDLAGIVDDADRRFLQGHIEADILTALGHSLLHWRCGDQHVTSPAITPCPELEPVALPRLRLDQHDPGGLNEQDAQVAIAALGYL